MTDTPSPGAPAASAPNGGAEAVLVVQVKGLVAPAVNDARTSEWLDAYRMLMVALRREKEPVETDTPFVVSSALTSSGKTRRCDTANSAMFCGSDTLRGTAFVA